MGRNNADFQNGLHHAPQPVGSEFAPEYKGEKLYHGSPVEITDGVINPGSDGRAWATDHPKEATVYGKYNGGEKPTHVYEVTPIDHKDITGVFGPRLYENGPVKHYHSGTGFRIVKKVN
jgi:hypothetical protein